ncbi:MAG: cytochrome b [Pseudoxanthomonas sp.]
MTLKNPSDRWGAVSQSLHWLIVLLIFTLCVVGLLMGDLPRTPKYFWVYTAHKSVGITVLALVILRLVWRLAAGAPRPVPNTPGWQHAIATVTHVLLYGIMLAMPLSGWLYDSASGLRPFKFFGLFNMPKLTAPDDGLRHLSHTVHEWGLYVLIALVLMHAGAALYHHVFLRDATLARMLPRGWLRVPPPEPQAKES